MTATAPSLLLLIPAYNEEARIGPVLEAYAEYFFHHYPGRFRLVVILNAHRPDASRRRCRQRAVRPRPHRPGRAAGL